jgi:RimJ/RimL family protein N-acetyltransferase
MDAYLTTERLSLRAFTVDDLDALEALDADPEVIRYIDGGRPTSPEELRESFLPLWLIYYERGDAWGFWAAIERATGCSLGWFLCAPDRTIRQMSRSSATGCAARHGARGSPPRGRVP